MADINPYFQQQHREYIFPIIEQKLAALKQRFPGAAIVNLGVGDIAKPLAPTLMKAICRAVEEMAQSGGIHGYGPSNGYLFLRDAIVQDEYARFGIGCDEVFISEGAGSDTANLQELFSTSSVVGILNPTYPAYFDSVLMSGKTHIISIPCTEENGFLPSPKEHCDLIYLCSPSNPTGVAMTRDHLKQWIDYALREKAVIILDNAYQAFITSPDVPQTIYEIEGAKECVIECRTFSKTAGFTGLRCAYAVLPKSVKGSIGGQMLSLNPLWDRRQSVKYNGASYPIQRGAQAFYTPEGKKETRTQIAAYLKEGKRLKEGLQQLGYTCYGGTDSPYIWWKNPEGFTSWQFFDHLLEKCHLISIPGTGFGTQGEGYMRLSTFATEATTTHALERIQRL